MISPYLARYVSLIGLIFRFRGGMFQKLSGMLPYGSSDINKIERALLFPCSPTRFLYVSLQVRTKTLAKLVENQKQMGKTRKIINIINLAQQNLMVSFYLANSVLHRT